MRTKNKSSVTLYSQYSTELVVYYVSDFFSNFFFLFFSTYIINFVCSLINNSSSVIFLCSYSVDYSFHLLSLSSLCHNSNNKACQFLIFDNIIIIIIIMIILFLLFIVMWKNNYCINNIIYYCQYMNSKN